jgi:predicted transcriptional regulator
MLLSLFGLIYLLLRITASYSASPPGNFLAFIDYSKWLFSGLIGTFGAWIGAGAAYFFGKENLAESSRSTENALKIQHEALRNTPKRDCIKDLALTTMNKDFMFQQDATTEEVAASLSDHPDYWWVPVMDNEGKGILEDLVHARVFWNDTFKGKKIAEIMEALSLDDTLGKLHGQAFFLKVALDDKIADVASKMDKSGAVIGIVVDQKGKPSYCFTKQNLLTVEQG